MLSERLSWGEKFSDFGLVKLCVHDMNGEAYDKFQCVRVYGFVIGGGMWEKAG